MTAKSSPKANGGVTWAAVAIIALLVFLGVGKASAEQPDEAPTSCVAEVTP